MPLPTAKDLQTAAKEARSAGDDELYFHLKQQLKEISTEQGPLRRDWEGLPQPQLLAIDVVNGVEAENSADESIEPEPEAEPVATVPVTGAWARACACDNPDCSCDLTARLDEWSGYSVEDPAAAGGDGCGLDQLDPKDAARVERADCSEAEMMVWHS